MIGRPILRAEEAVSETLELKEVMCGDEAAAVRQSLDIKYPVSPPLLPHVSTSLMLPPKVENGIVKNWEDMEHLWNYTFYEKLVVRILMFLHLSHAVPPSHPPCLPWSLRLIPQRIRSYSLSLQ
jgi:actin-related protein